MLTLQFVPYTDIEQLGTNQRITKLLNIVKKNKIVLMQGRLRPEEETHLIERTMTDVQDNFRGIEICTIYPEEKKLQVVQRLRKEMIKFLIGNRDGITLIGPASVVKEIRRDPNKIQLFAFDKPLTAGKTKRAKKRRK